MRTYLLFFTSIVLFIAGCSASTKNVDTKSAEAKVKSSQEIDEINSKIIQQGLNLPSSPADYLIGPADLLEVKVFESESLSSAVRVSSRGYVTLPLLGNVEIADLSAREGEQKIEDLYRDSGYLIDPHVSIFIVEHKSRTVSVVGAVEEPGSYELLARQTLLDALANAKGLTTDAGRTVYINRRNSDGSRNSYIVDIEQLISGRQNDINVPIQPGDLIFVPEGGNIFIEGAVIKPGSYNIEQGSTTVSQAVAMSGGLASYASKDVKVIRYLGNSNREIYELNLDQIRSGEQEDPLVNDRDAIIVGASGTKRFLYGLRLSLGFGLVGVGYDPPDK